MKLFALAVENATPDNCGGGNKACQQPMQYELLLGASCQNHVSTENADVTIFKYYSKRAHAYLCSTKRWPLKTYAVFLENLKLTIEHRMEQADSLKEIKR